MSIPPDEPNQNYQAPEADRPAEVSEKKAGDNFWLGIGIGLAVLVMGVAAELVGKGRYDGKILFSAVAILVAAIALVFGYRRRLALGLMLSLGVSLLLGVGGCMLLVVGLSFFEGSL